MIHPQWMYQAIAADPIACAVVVIAWCTTISRANRRRKANNCRNNAPGGPQS